MSILRLKHEDTKRIAFLAVPMSVIAGLAGFLGWMVALGVFLVLFPVTVFLLIAHYQRASEEDRVQQTQDMQDLQFIQSALSLKRPLPYFTRWSSSPALAAQLIGLVRVFQPARILELGSGVSTVVMAMALREQGSGQLTSVDHDPVYAEKTRRELDAQDLKDWAVVHEARLAPTDTPRGSVPWYDITSINDLDQIDLLVIDGPPRKTCADARLPAFELLRSRLAPGAIVVLDDTDRIDEATSVSCWMNAARDRGERIIPCRKGITVVQMP